MYEPCNDHGTGAATFYNWKGKYGEMDAPQLRKQRKRKIGYSKST
ncbi:hypothetical protein [Flagellimonas olearia]